MKCFKIFDSKAKKRGKSSTELGHQNPSSTKPPTRLVKSTGSIFSPRTIPELYREKGHSLKKFSYSELRIATNNFDRLLKIGEGGFGSVYRGSIKPPDGRFDPLVVAIKKLNRNSMQVVAFGVDDRTIKLEVVFCCLFAFYNGQRRLLHLFNTSFIVILIVRSLNVYLIFPASQFPCFVLLVIFD